MKLSVVVVVVVGLTTLVIWGWPRLAAWSDAALAEEERIAAQAAVAAAQASEQAAADAEADASAAWDAAKSREAQLRSEAVAKYESENPSSAPRPKSRPEQRRPALPTTSSLTPGDYRNALELSWGGLRAADRRELCAYYLLDPAGTVRDFQSLSSRAYPPGLVDDFFDDVCG